MKEVLPFTAESSPSAAAVGALGEVAVTRPDVFEPGVVGGGVDIIKGTLGHSGDGGDGNMSYHIPGRVHDGVEVKFS